MATLLDDPAAAIEIRPLSPVIGAEIEGVDLTRPLKRPGGCFGDLHIHSGVAGLADHPEIVRIHADAASTFVAGEDWHSDLSCDPMPPMGGTLHLHTVLPVGGDTAFASMYAACDALGERMKAHLDGLYAMHDGARVFAAFSPPGRNNRAAQHSAIWNYFPAVRSGHCVTIAGDAPF